MIHEREYGFLLPDRSRIVGPVGGRHNALAEEYFPSDIRHEREEFLESFWLAMEAGWLCYAYTPTYLVLHLFDDAAVRERAADLVLEHREVDSIMVSIHSSTEARHGRRVGVNFGLDYRAAVRWLRTSTLPAWSTNVMIMEYASW